MTLEEKLATKLWSQANPAVNKLRECLDTLKKSTGGK